MSIKKLKHTEWETLLLPEMMTEGELEAHAAVVAEYIQAAHSDALIDLSAIERATEIEVTEELLASKEIVIDQISNNELFEYLKEENATINLNLRFPRLKRINRLFWFLHHLAKRDIADTKIYFTNTEALSIGFYQIIEAAMFFGYLKCVKIEEELYFVPTSYYEAFLSEPIEEQYSLFLASLGRNETVSEILNIQLNDSIYDNISRQMVFNLLVNDPNIQQEKLTKEEIQHILNHLRYWYLNIKQMILDN